MDPPLTCTPPLLPAPPAALLVVLLPPELLVAMPSLELALAVPPAPPPVEPACADWPPPSPEGEDCEHATRAKPSTDRTAERFFMMVPSQILIEAVAEGQRVRKSWSACAARPWISDVWETWR